MLRVGAILAMIGLGVWLQPAARAQEIVPGGWSSEVGYQSFGFAAPGGVAGAAVVGGFATPGLGGASFGSLPVAPAYGGFPSRGAGALPGFQAPPRTIDGTGALIHAVRRTSSRRRRS